MPLTFQIAVDGDSASVDVIKDGEMVAAGELFPFGELAMVAYNGKTYGALVVKGDDGEPETDEKVYEIVTIHKGEFVEVLDTDDDEDEDGDGDGDGEDDDDDDDDEVETNEDGGKVVA